jgi:peptidoglycan/xylan/chitin deacetylase (PgdA/CDA1 family)
MVLLSFDIEEFDMPFEYGKNITFEDQMTISIDGSNIILDLLKKHNYKATFFSTATFAIHAPQIIERIKNEGHELASHGYYHSQFEIKDLLASKLKLQELFGSNVFGFRMPRMMPVDNEALADAGYVYNSSINPTWLPGRYNNLHVSRAFFRLGDVLQLPASVSPFLRIPLFWLSFHNFPLWLYQHFAKRTYQKDGYLNLYFHPWEFTDLSNAQKYGFPGYVSKNSGKDMISRMDLFMGWLNQQGYQNCTIHQFIEEL